jgi:Zinc dependent phospholipase C
MAARWLIAALLCGSFAAPRADAYSVLSHEAIIDAAWDTSDTSIKALLLERFPGASEEELRKAHAYAYGGAIIQDMGYYPFGSHLFSDLVHYVRSGDFIVNEITGAQDLNEYAFALGSLAHYAADNIGHPVATNLAVPMLYPKVRRKFGRMATYEDNPGDHLKAEFSFDVAEVAEHHFAPQSYHDFIGFEVSKPLLERAFLKTYGVPLKDVASTVDLSLSSYRHSVASVIPEMTKVAWREKEKELVQASPGLTKRKFVYALARSSYEKEWGTDYGKPGPWARFLAFLFELLPKVGPLRALTFHTPTPASQKLFMDSFTKSLKLYQEQLGSIGAHTAFTLANTNFDTGEPSRFGAYRMADDACAKLLIKLNEHRFDGIDAELRHSLLEYYGSAVPTDAKAAAALVLLRSSGE